jgi:putative two-component system response regulator
VPGKILVVDDDFSARKLTVEFLTEHGYPVTGATDGRAALDSIAQAPPDLILLDVRMPGLDGFEVCRRLKDQPETRLIPVVLLTALADTQDRVRGLEAGADDFLSKPVDRNELLARVRSLLQLKSFTDELERAESVVFTLARSIEEKDAYSEGHCERLACMSALLGEQMNLPAEQVAALRRGGIVHDIGKVGIPDSVLLKPGRLNLMEWRIMQQHPVIGERICAPLKSFKLVLPIIRHHHERFDGSGYPDGLAGESIPLTARILQVVDVYDALVTRRPYKPPYPPDEAVEVIATETARGWWDPEIVAEFRRFLAMRREPLAPEPQLGASAAVI